MLTKTVNKKTPIDYLKKWFWVVRVDPVVCVVCVMQFHRNTATFTESTGLGGCIPWAVFSSACETVASKRDEAVN
jgi:hypothetical protein